MLHVAVRTFAALAVALTVAHAADTGTQLISSARSGDVAAVRALLASGAKVNATDKMGRTPLMRAAEEGRTEIVKLLTESGADTSLRDKQGFTAYALAALSERGGRKPELLALFAARQAIHLQATADWTAESMSSSCFQSRPELAKTVGALRPDASVLGAFAEFARVTGAGVVDLQTADATGLREPLAAPPPAAPDADFSVLMQVRPGISCVSGSDRLSFAIDMMIARAGSGQLLFKKTYGAGLKGLHSQMVTNSNQYDPFFAKWAGAHAESMYWDILREALRAK
jgi:hypothetical protein